MNTKHAQYMLTVLQEGSITNAAKKLYVSQPSLSQMIKLVENNLGAPIFNRNTDPITLTFAGEKYIEAAKQILTINQNLAREIQEINEEEHGTIRFGIPVQRAMQVIPYMLPFFIISLISTLQVKSDGVITSGRPVGQAYLRQFESGKTFRCPGRSFCTIGGLSRQVGSAHA